MRLRAAEEADMAAVTAIYAHHVLTGYASFEEVPPNTPEMTARFRTFTGNGLPYIVAEKDGRVLGYSYAGPYRTRSAYRFTVENSVYVDKDEAGQGIGRALLTELIRLCEAGPWQQMIGIIGDSGNHASIGLHRALGFRMVGTLEKVGFKHGRWVDSVLMQRPLK
ncbi:MAG: N-acetyltransferase family protein [Parvibaculaceae bacterium]